MARRLFCAVAFFTALSVVRTESAEFSIKPNGKVSHEKASIGDVVCVFTYSAHGGTDELWKISIEKPAEEYVCTIERPSQTSYLYFQSYSASVLGYAIENAEVFDNSGAVLQYDKFVIEDRVVKPMSQGVNIVKIVLTVKQKQK